MDEQKQLLCATLMYFTIILRLKKRRTYNEIMVKRKISKPRNPKRFGVNPILMARKSQGFYDNLLKEARITAPYIFFNFTRMTPATFDKLLDIVGPLLQKNSMREPISPGCRLAITLRFLATGDSYPSLSYAFRVGVPTVCNIVRETLEILWVHLQPKVIPVPARKNLLHISKEYLSKWSLPNCVGAIDGKHVVIKAPDNSGSLFFNYKKNYSIILLAVCDANYFFTYVDVGAYGSQSDGGVLNQSEFGKKLFDNNLDLPPAQELPYCPQKANVPFYFVGDEAFPLKENLMRPYSKPRAGCLRRQERIFNYRLSRARRMIENTFGVMVARFRILHRVIDAHPNTATNIIKAILCLHNFIRRENNHFYMQEMDVDREINGKLYLGSWRQSISSEQLALQNLGIRLGSRNAGFNALGIRDYLRDYVNGPGAQLAPWQEDVIDKTN